MVKIPTKLPAVTSQGANHPPAVKPRPAGRLRVLDDYARRAEDVADFFQYFDQLMDQVGDCTGITASPCSDRTLKQAGNALQRYDEHYREMAERCERDRKDLDPESAYDENDDITEEMVSGHITALLAAFPNDRAADPEARFILMVEDVMAARPRLTVLDSACRQVRRTSKFPPTIAEVLAAIKEQEAKWEERWNAIECIATVADDMRRLLPEELEHRAVAKREQEERRLAAEEQKRVDDELRSQLRAKPLVVGDRVKWRDHHCAGVIVKLGDDYADVVFDEAWRHGCSKKEIVRLLPGDSLYRPNEYEARRYRKKVPVVGDRVFIGSDQGPGTIVPLYSESQDCAIMLDSGGKFISVSQARWEYLALCGHCYRLIWGDHYFVAGQLVWEPPPKPKPGRHAEETE
jgi:hypothetical protein